ncbi:hypothetical protein Dimus_023088 [Dionaea muscipula]
MKETLLSSSLPNESFHPSSLVLHMVFAKYAIPTLDEPHTPFRPAESQKLVYGHPCLVSFKKYLASMAKCASLPQPIFMRLFYVVYHSDTYISYQCPKGLFLLTSKVSSHYIPFFRFSSLCVNCFLLAVICVLKDFKMTWLDLFCVIISVMTAHSDLSSVPRQHFYISSLGNNYSYLLPLSLTEFLGCLTNTTACHRFYQINVFVLGKFYGGYSLLLESFLKISLHSKITEFLGCLTNTAASHRFYQINIFLS